MNPQFNSKKDKRVLEIDYIVVDDLDGRLDKAFDLLFKQVLEDRKNLKTSKKISTPVIVSMYN